MHATLTSSDVKVTDARFGQSLPLVRCRGCGFVFAGAASSEALLHLYHDLVDEEYAAGAVPRTRQMVRLLDRLSSHRRDLSSLLDIGAGTGLLVDAARTRGIDAEGVEPSHWAVTRAAANGVRLHEGTYPHPALVGRRFDAVTAIDVIEHLADPMPLLVGIREALNPGGVAVLATPDVDSLAARVLGRRWWHYRPAHVCFFGAGSMHTALERAGLRLIARERQRWWFPLGYLLERLSFYLPPVRALRPLLGSGGLPNRIVPVNPHDSWVYFALRR